MTSSLNPFQKGDLLLKELEFVFKLLIIKNSKKILLLLLKLVIVLTNSNMRLKICKFVLAFTLFHDNIKAINFLGFLVLITSIL